MPLFVFVFVSNLYLYFDEEEKGFISADFVFTLAHESDDDYESR